VEEIKEFKPFGSARKIYSKENVTHEDELILGMKNSEKDNALFDSIARGNSKDLKIIQDIIHSDVSSSLFGTESEKHIINRANLRGQTPLYVATLNGNLNIIKLLLEMGANALLLSDTGSKKEESLLDVCVRWNHYSTLEFLLSSVNWPSKYISDSSKKCKTKDMKLLYKNLVKKKS